MELGWIVIGGFLMSLIALVGSATTLLRPAVLERLVLPLVALAAGTLIGGALFHMLPAGLQVLTPLAAGAWLSAGFSVFLLLEQFLHWHHSHRGEAPGNQPTAWLILLGDGLHNFLGCLSIASAFLLNPHVGITAWFAAAAHEVPQELGDFGILVHSGWSRRRALAWNFASGLMFLLGALAAYWLSLNFEIAGLILFGAGNFIYIAASDLVPEIKAHSRISTALENFLAFAAGVLLMLWLAVQFVAMR